MALDPGSRPNSRGGRVAIALAALVGAALGVGGTTFRYAEGLSYLSTDPAACANCHIMQPQYDSWQKASHHTVATCVDCHLPHDFIGKYYAKAENGYHHWDSTPRRRRRWCSARRSTTRGRVSSPRPAGSRP